jgi:hypothetical protein
MGQAAIMTESETGPYPLFSCTLVTNANDSLTHSEPNMSVPRLKLGAAILRRPTHSPRKLFRWCLQASLHTQV